MSNLFQNFIELLNVFDVIFLMIMIYSIFQCFIKGFTLSLLSFMKWIFAIVATIILVPRFQPLVGQYIESEFINNIGIGIAVFAISLFIAIVAGRSLSKVVTWSGVGSIDKTFGFLFGFFKGYVVSICLFSLFNWFYPYQNWGIPINDTVSFNIVKKGSEILIKEFPSNEDFINTKEKIEKI